MVITEIMTIAVVKVASSKPMLEAAYVTASVVVNCVVEATPKIIEDLFENFTNRPEIYPDNSLAVIRPAIRVIKRKFLGLKCTKMPRSVFIPTRKKNTGTNKPYAIVCNLLNNSSEVKTSANKIPTKNAADMGWTPSPEK